MSHTKLFSAAVLCTAVALLSLSASTSPVQSQEAVSETSSSSEARDLDLKFINAELALAKANLDYVLEQNSKRAGSYSLIFIEELKTRIKIYEVWASQLETGNPQFTPIAIQKAKGELKLARLRLDNDEKLRAQFSRSISEGRLNRRRLAVESAKRWLEKVSHPSYQDLSRDERFQWRFVILGKNLLELRLEQQR